MDTESRHLLLQPLTAKTVDSGSLAEDETALDMNCLHCTTRTRVIVHASEWRMSVWAYYIVEVLALARGRGSS
jgi:hypothetical protein